MYDSNSVYRPNLAAKVDPTGEMFLRAEDRIGGPTDPITGFEDSLSLLFPEKSEEAKIEYPIYKLMSKYSFSRTPMSHGHEHNLRGQESINRLSFLDVSGEI